MPGDLLDRAVARGIISADQRAALAALAAEPEIAGAEAAPGVNAVTVTYWAGAIVVLFALAWFLVDRWRNLGPGGVLAVCAAYALVFAVVARWLLRRGLHLAASIATLLVVAMVPPMAWAGLSLAGWWVQPDLRPTRPVIYRPTLRDLTQWIPIDVATIAASLVALRWRRFGILVVPAAIGFWFLLLHVAPLVVGADLSQQMEGYTILVVATTLLATGYLLDRRHETSDYAGWVYIVGLAAMFFASAINWNRHPHVVPHVVLALSIVAVALSMALGRRSFLIASAIGFVSYLSWLAFDVFRRTVSFPIVLAGFGLAIILAGVQVQRRYPALSRRMAARRASGGVSVAGGTWGFLGAVVVSLLLFGLAIPDARRRDAERQKRDQQMLEQMRRDSIAKASGAAVRRDSAIVIPR